MKHCPRNVFCVTNGILVTFLAVSILIIIFFYVNVSNMMALQQSRTNVTIDVNEKRNDMSDVLLNPYTPPLRDNQLLSSYRQVGILTPVNSIGMGNNHDPVMLVLMGRPLYSNRDKWQFYAIAEKSFIKLPLTRNGKSCTNEYGCDNIYNNETVIVEGYNDAFKATIYDNDTIRYMPM